MRINLNKLTIEELEKILNPTNDPNISNSIKATLEANKLINSDNQVSLYEYVACEMAGAK